jgi:hypothetical protein
MSAAGAVAIHTGRTEAARFGISTPDTTSTPRHPQSESKLGTSNPANSRHALHAKPGHGFQIKRRNSPQPGQCRVHDSKAPLLYYRCKVKVKK